MQMGYSQEQSVYDSYVGTWKWTDEKTDSEFVIILKKGHADLTLFNRGIKECIIGVYRYKKNGVIVADNTNEISDIKEYLKYPIVIKMNMQSIMKLHIIDYLLKNKSGEYKYMTGSSNVILAEGSDGTLEMKLAIVDDGYYTYTDDMRVFPKGTSLPTNIVLTKVE